MTEKLQVPLDLNQALAPIGVERFFADYWQQRAVALQLDAGMFARVMDAIGPLDIARFASMAKGGTQAWIAGEHIAHSVVMVDASNAADFFAMGATLYFLHVPLEPLTGGLAAFLGVPPSRLIASIFLTPASGGASPHFDMHENFTIQLTGGKRWLVGDRPVIAGPVEGHIVGQKIPASMAGLIDTVSDDTPHTFDLSPGTLFYLPRGLVHRTGAGEVSWSINLSYCRTMWLELLQGDIRNRLMQSPQWRGSVTGLGPFCHPAAKARNIFPGLAAALPGAPADPGEMDRLCREFLANPTGRR